MQVGGGAHNPSTQEEAEAGELSWRPAWAT
jgi:hypothetical protein